MKPSSLRGLKKEVQKQKEMYNLILTKNVG
jgi:hypothetical protein